MALYWMNKSVKDFWTNWLNEWFSDSHIDRHRQSLASLLIMFVFLNKLFEWMIQLLIHIDSTFHSWMNLCFWTNRLCVRFTDSCRQSLGSFLNESVFLNESFVWTILQFTHIDRHFFRSWMNQCFWMNHLQEWFSDSYRK